MSIEENILNNQSSKNMDVLQDMFASLQAARKLQDNKLDYQLHERVNFYFQDIEGDWLENWDVEDDDDQA